MENPIEIYFKAHKTQLWLFKNGTVLLVPLAAVAAIEYLQGSDILVKGTLIAAITALNLYVSRLNPEKVWEGVGAGKRKR